MNSLVQYSDEEGSSPPLQGPRNDLHPAAHLSSATPRSTTPSHLQASSSSPRSSSRSLGVKRSRTGNEVPPSTETSRLRHAAQLSSPAPAMEQNSETPKHARSRSMAEGSEAPGAQSVNELLERAEDTMLDLYAPPPCRSESTRDEVGADREWGLGQELHGNVEETLAAKLSHFHSLKAQGTHFNTSLQTSRAFRNPHIYAKLVRFVDIDETSSNYAHMAQQAGGSSAWDSANAEVLREGNKDKIADRQKQASEARSSNQAPGKRSAIDFTTAQHGQPNHRPSGGERGTSNGSSRTKELEAARRKAEQVRDRLAGISGVGQSRPPSIVERKQEGRSHRYDHSRN